MPLGVHSKKDMGEWRTLWRRSAWRWREAMMPPREMATVVPNTATPAGGHKEEKGSRVEGDIGGETRVRVTVTETECDVDCS